MALNPNPTSNNTYGGLYIKEVTLPSGNVYEIVDYGAREVLSTLSGYTTFLGVTTTELEDGTTSAVITVNNESVTASAGSIAIYSTGSTTAGRMAKEFIYDGSKWQFFGDISAANLGTLAYKNSVSVTYTKFSSVSSTCSTVSASGSFTPSGTVNTGTGTVTSSGSYTAKGGVSVGTSTTSVKITSSTSAPAEEVQTNYWHYTPQGSVAVSASSTGSSTTMAYVSITGRDVISTITTAAPTSNISGIITYAEVTDNNLKLNQIKPSTANSISASTSASVIKGLGSITASATFSGTGIWAPPFSITYPTGAATFTGTASTVSVTGTFITSATFSGTAGTVNVQSSDKFVTGVSATTASAAATVGYSP